MTDWQMVGRMFGILMKAVVTCGLIRCFINICACLLPYLIASIIITMLLSIIYNGNKCGNILQCFLKYNNLFWSFYNWSLNLVNKAINV